MNSSVEATAIVLQSLIWPEPEVCTEQDLYFRREGIVGIDLASNMLVFERGGKINTGTYFNLFGLGKWAQRTEISKLSSRIEGEGRFEISIVISFSNHSNERLSQEIVDVRRDVPLDLDASKALDHARQLGASVLYLEILALSPGEIRDVAWTTVDAPKRTPHLAVAVTTFKREEAVAQSARRFSEFTADHRLRDVLSMIIVDNGQSAEIEDTDRIRSLHNPNLGGAGGFTRGMMEAKAQGATHCLFMDDDASIHMGSLERTYQMLAFATDPKTAIPGAMINGQQKWALFENGATFDRRCYARQMGTDLRAFHEVCEIEFTTTYPEAHNFYGGWWYFAFPLEYVERYAFPYFVRGDDVSFSLSHDFNFLMMSGVASFQETFTAKESPLTWYLDMRSHLAHHLTIDRLYLSSWATILPFWKFVLKNIARMQYETVESIFVAISDVMEGPDFFEKNSDMSERRKSIAALRSAELWRDVDPANRPRPHHKFPSLAEALFWKFTMNGHLLPGFKRLGRDVVLVGDEREQLHLQWGARSVTLLDATQEKQMQLRHSKRTAFRQIRTLVGLTRTFLKNFPELREEWKEGYARLTSEAYWHDALELDEKPLDR